MKIQMKVNRSRGIENCSAVQKALDNSFSKKFFFENFKDADKSYQIDLYSSKTATSHHFDSL